MKAEFHENKAFENIDYTGKTLSKSEFAACEFVNCNFTEVNLSESDFIDCTFKNCNFSLTKLVNTSLKNVKFINSKVLGIDFTVCRSLLFSVGFRDCILDYSTFFQRKMKKTDFINCSLREVDFEEADMSTSVFDNCDMLMAKFIHTNLEKADLSTSRNYAVDPELNKIKQAKFSYPEVISLLAKYDIEVN